MTNYRISENPNAEFVRATIVWAYLSELLIEGTLSSEFDEEEELMTVLVSTFINIIHFCPDKYKDKNHEFMVNTLPKFEEAFPGLTKLVYGED